MCGPTRRASVWDWKKSALSETWLPTGLAAAKLFNPERSLKDAFRNFSSVIWTLPRLQFFRKHFFRTGFAYGCHCFDLEFIRNLKFFARAIVIEPLHSVHHQTLVETL